MIAPGISTQAARPSAVDHALRHRAHELLRLAVLLTGAWPAAQQMLAQAVRRTADDLAARGAAAEPGSTTPAAVHAETRAWLVRCYLSEGRLLGAPLAADVDQARRVTPIDGEGPLARRLRASSALQRAVLVLHYVYDLDDAEIADAAGSTAEGIARYRADVLRRLRVLTDGATARSGTAGEPLLRRLVDQLDREAYLDTGPVLAQALDRPEAADPTSDEPVPAEPVFRQPAPEAPVPVHAEVVEPADIGPGHLTRLFDEVGVPDVPRAHSVSPAHSRAGSRAQTRVRTQAARPRRGPLALLGKAVTGHARVVALLAILLAVGCGFVAPTLLSLMTGDIGDPGAQSARATALVERASGAGADDLAVVVDLGARWPSTADAAAVVHVARRLGAVEGIVQVAAPSPGSALSRAFVARDRRSALVTAGIASAADSNSVARAVQRSFAGHGGVTVGGTAVVEAEFDSRVGSDLSRAELLAFPILLLLGIWIFRGVVAALVPLLVGGLSIAATLAALRGVVAFTTLSQYVLNLVIGLGLGLAIDYSLFMISRYREEILVDGYGAPAIIRTVQRAGRTVLFSSSTVTCALASLLLFPQEFLYSMGIGGVVVTVLAGLGAVVVLPALLMILGPRIDALTPSRWRRVRVLESVDPRAGRWYRISLWVMGHARIVLPATVLVAAVFAAPALATRFGDVGADSLPTSSAARMVTERIAAQFRGAADTQIVAAVRAPLSSESAVHELASSMRSAAGSSARITAPAYYAGNRVWVVSIAVRGSPYGADARTAVRDVRALPTRLPVLVGGDAASFDDLRSSVGATLPWALAVVVVAVLLIMFLLTGSVVLAAKTVVLDVLNLAMTFGVLVFVFQFGHLESMLRFRSIGRLDLDQPILVAIIALGLSTDYGVFLFARIVEAHDEGRDDTEAVSIGLGRSGRVISSAALLLCIAVGAFSSSSILFIKELGLGVAVAVVLDATLVRALLVPSAMALMGAANWWAPGRLRRPRIRTP